MTDRARRWLAGRTERERRLLRAATALVGVVAVALAATAVVDDLATLRARVAAHERELAQVRRLAATVGGAAAPGAPGSLLGHVQAATDAAGVGDRVAAMTPDAAGDPGSEGLTVRLSGASLAETVHLLHALGGADAALGVSGVVLRKHPDDVRRFEVTLQLATRRAP